MAKRPVLEVIYEDNHLLVINKPPLLPTMGVADGERSLVVWCKQYLKDKYNKPGKVYLGVVSRLDAVVSGVIVLAKTSKAAARLNRQFAEGQVQKVYLAIVDGHQISPHGELDHWLVKDDQRHMMRVVPAHLQGAQRALLRFRRMGRSADQSLIEVDLVTGRKHQIRRQLSAIGHPIAGDRKYGSPTKFAVGIALHSAQLTIRHPTRQESLTFRCKPSSWWKLSDFQPD